MTFTATLRLCRPNTHSAMLRLTLFPGEAFRVPAPFRHVAVWSGAAWVSHAGQDRQLTAGEEIEFDAKRDQAVISPLGASTLVFEMREGQSCR
jgi:hypothetical protein